MDSAFRIEDFLIQPDLNQISTEGSIHQVEPKVMGVLVHLAQHAGEARVKERLIQAVRADTFVTDEVLITGICELRDIFGDDAKNPHVIQTIPNKGYRLIADVSSVEQGSSRYRILEKLGQGATGEVFLAEDWELRRKMAFKFLPEEGTTMGTPTCMSPEQVRNEEVEARSDLFSMGITDRK